MAKNKKTLDDASLRAMANLATSSSDLSKLQENYGWNAEETITPEPKPEALAVEASTPPVEQLANEPVKETSVVSTVEESIQSQTEVLNIIPKEPATSGKKVDKYTNTYLQPIKGFERPTKVAYISKRSHSYIAFLQRYADLTGSKVSMQEIMENIFRQHFSDNKAEIEMMRKTVQQKEAELHE
ncbi:DUF3408 domain-containing protein [Spirosoma linguale]|uniref:DUF3408 domain-containing protein n=1 Tax=Spirosoma linguale (strain ATCC 33905 / DSM 74 / LMG 10896 / Claus 1) TaxID=504472 RepID=D2QV28_SPILD|nr:hypothetical protein Slin_6704 [Spirosoma linguale DSM 74]